MADNNSVLRRNQVELRTGLPRSTIYLKVSKGEFPAPIRLGQRSVGWLESEISDWIAAQVEKSRAINLKA